MRIGDILYFAPEIKFKDLDFDDTESIVNAFQNRINGYYLAPAVDLANHGHWFGAGVICVAAIDSLARYAYGGGVRIRIVRWLCNNIAEFRNTDPSNSDQTLAFRFYEEFRNGLVHEGRIKNGGQFSGDFDFINIIENVMIINSGHLVDRTSNGLDNYRERLLANNANREQFLARLIEDFKIDLQKVN